MIDRDLVSRKLSLILADVKALAPIAAKTRAEYLASEVDEVLVERYLERIIGRMIDLNYHLLVESGHPPPKDYYESFTQLAKLGALPAEFAVRIAACAGVRNRLVHEYDEIDSERVHEAAGAAVHDVPEYARCLQRFVEAARS
jgi:uncharacterized protein YutE (UPF0331/DUF86 family)